MWLSGPDVVGYNVFGRCSGNAPIMSSIESIAFYGRGVHLSVVTTDEYLCFITVGFDFKTKNSFRHF